MHLEEVAPVHDAADDVVHVVRLVGLIRHDVEQLFSGLLRRIDRFDIRRDLGVVCRQIAEEASDAPERRDFVPVREVRDAGSPGVHRGTAQLFEAHVLVGHRLHDVRARHEHVADAVDHEDEIGDGGRVDRPAGTRAEDGADLRNHSGSQRVAQKEVRVAAERYDALLDARATRIVQADHGDAGLERVVQHLHDLLGVRLRERAPEHGEVLAEHVDGPAVDRPVTGDDPVSGISLILEPEVGASVLDEAIQLDKRAGIQQNVQPLARAELPFLVLASQPFGSATFLARASQLLELVQLGSHRHLSILTPGSEVIRLRPLPLPPCEPPLPPPHPATGATMRHRGVEGCRRATHGSTSGESPSTCRDQDETGR